MSDVSAIEKELTSVLTTAAKQLNWSKYTLNLNLEAQIGDGFLGEFYKVSTTNNETNETVHLAVKKAPIDERRNQSPIDRLYKNEIFFYSNIVPVFKEFEKEHQIQDRFVSIPKYITSVDEVKQELIVFKDITKEGFILREKDLLLDDAHARLIFKTYGHFHAISFCLKQQKPEKFANLTKSLPKLWLHFAENDVFVSILNKLAKKSLESLDPDLDGPVMEKFQKYVDNTQDIYKNSLIYEGEYKGILHGDCWSNNMMFKYRDSVLEDINLLDFQLVSVDTPVYDLSYFFYTGGTKELFDDLENYLDIYHESFSKAARNLGCDPNKLLPRHALTNDWKKHAKLGMMLSTMLIKIKLTTKEDAIQLIESGGKKSEENEVGEPSDVFMNTKYDEKLFKKRVRDLLVHMHEIDAL